MTRGRAAAAVRRLVTTEQKTSRLIPRGGILQEEAGHAECQQMPTVERGAAKRAMHMGTQWRNVPVGISAFRCQDTQISWENLCRSHHPDCQLLAISHAKGLGKRIGQAEVGPNLLPTQQGQRWSWE